MTKKTDEFVSREGAARDVASPEVRSKYPCPKCGTVTTPLLLHSPSTYFCTECQTESEAGEWLGKSAPLSSTRETEKDIVDLADGYIGDSKTVREQDGVIYIEQEHSDGSSHVIRMDPLVLAHFLGWLEDSEIFKSIPRGWSNLLPEKDDDSPRPTVIGEEEQ